MSRRLVVTRGGRPRERAMRVVGREEGRQGGIGGHGGHTERRNEVGTRREVGKRGTNIELAAVVRGRSAFRERIVHLDSRREQADMCVRVSFVRGN